VEEWTVVRGWTSNITVKVKSSSSSMDSLLLLLPPLFPASSNASSGSSNSSSSPSTTVFLDGCALPMTRFVACLALALPTPTGMSPLPQGFVCYRGFSREDTAPMGHMSFEEGHGELIGSMLTVYPGSGLRASVTFRSNRHSAIVGVEADETLNKAIAGEAAIRVTCFDNNNNKNNNNSSNNNNNNENDNNNNNNNDNNNNTLT
jgi:hypothetical protein